MMPNWQVQLRSFGESRKETGESPVLPKSLGVADFDVIAIRKSRRALEV